MASNRWLKESCVPRKAPHDSSFGFVALNSELLVMTLLQGVDTSQIQRSRNCKGNTLLYLQIYHPGKKTWRSLVAMPPSNCTLDFTTVVMCAITV
ncbi:hypothetical protein Nepgr_029881 [Nepenthes gracilis]|uniref:Uncharacterized protein n=1 Tax=Nepenthes gracilis TaxID=150966 RepID=A0AAD3TDC7_NEPGR|nr:hypothetical protein Nepgr_029881 [Nepenthes gracilis]